MSDPIHIAIVAGEESGDQLGADLLGSLRSLHSQEVSVSGVGGKHLQSLGMESLFDPSEIALMGIGAVLVRVPSLLRRITQTANAIIAGNPDCLIIVDSPDFTHRVARKVRKAAPHIPIINYVCPSVWAWRPQRAPRMRAYIDHVLAILPFEPEVLVDLGGPASTFVGHRLVDDSNIRMAAEFQKRRNRQRPEKTVLVLPGSRKREVISLLPTFGETISLMSQRGNRFKILLPTVEHVAGLVREGTRNWKIQPDIIVDSAEKWQGFADADVAIAASGTVLLELALVGVPTISAYRVEPMVRPFMGMISTWTGCLPNLIADRVVIPEYFDWMLRPGHMCRYLESLMQDGSMRVTQLDGFATIREKMQTDRPSGEIAAGVVLEQIGRH